MQLSEPRIRGSYPVSEQVPIAYPSGLLVRERALIVNLDSIRLIAGRDQVRWKGFSDAAATGRHRHSGCLLNCMDDHRTPCGKG